ncbi:MAG: hypothetical protein KatS3mg124_2047 [Porticoccaceae bacterium]|nr:MAG: hypothetical protein KatS3mg124_2047 [Porticoccaceae bacterium]
MKILRLNLAGHPIEWLEWQEAVCLYARGLVVWTLGEVVKRVRGARCRLTGRRSVVELASIVACGGSRLTPPRTQHPLTNRALFARDHYLCMYCGAPGKPGELTRDHVVPLSRGGTDRWENVVAACRRCNQRKGNKLPEEAGMELLALPYRPNHAEYLALINSRRILGDQMEFLLAQFTECGRARFRGAGILSAAS